MLKSLHHRRPRRSGFSLIEILVVITVITILISSMAVMFGSIAGSARRAATATTLRKLDSLVQARFDELQKSFREQEDKRLQKNEYVNINVNANLASITTLAPTAPAAARRIIAKLDRYRGTFPQREEDLFGPDGNESTTADNSPLLSAWRAVNPTTKSDRTLESSELLNLALTFGTSAGAGKEVIDSLKPAHVQDKDGNGLAELYDDLGNPLRFYNAPTRLIRPGGAGTLPTPAQYALANQLMTGIPAQASSPTDFTSVFNQDPLDPKGALRQLSTAAGVPSWYMPPAAVETLFHTVDTYYRPIIVSVGEDGVLGLGEPTATGIDRLANVLSADEASDNITSLQAVGAN